MAKKSAKKAETKTAVKKTENGNPTNTKKESGKLSAFDAAAKVVSEAGTPMSAKAIIDAMAAKGYWSSPGGQTSHATLYAAIIREINVKGAESRFAKVDRGQFALNNGAMTAGSAK